MAALGVGGVLGDAAKHDGNIKGIIPAGHENYHFLSE